MDPLKRHPRRFGMAAILAAGITLTACGGSGSGLPSGSRPTTSTGVPSVTKPSLVPPTTLVPTTSTERPAIATTTPTTSPATTTPEPPTTTRTTRAPTTTTAATTATTVVPAETTTEPSTVTTPSSTSTSELPTSTTGAQSTTTSSSSTPWGWIIGGVVVLAGLVLALVLFLLARSRRAARSAWNQAAQSALQQATSARELLQDPEVRATTEGRESVDGQVERAAKALDQLLLTAPDDESKLATSTTASSLRGLMFAFEAERLLRSGDRPPTAAELAEADATKRARSQELDLALERMVAQIGPKEEGAGAENVIRPH